MVSRNHPVEKMYSICLSDTGLICLKCLSCISFSADHRPSSFFMVEKTPVSVFFTHSSVVGHQVSLYLGCCAVVNSNMHSELAIPGTEPTFLCDLLTVLFPFLNRGIPIVKSV